MFDPEAGIRTLDDEIRAQDTHGGDADTRLGRAVRGAEAGEDNGCCAAHGTEEGLLSCQYESEGLRACLCGSSDSIGSSREPER